MNEWMPIFLGTLVRMNWVAVSPQMFALMFPPQKDGPTPAEQAAALCQERRLVLTTEPGGQYIFSRLDMLPGVADYNELPAVDLASLWRSMAIWSQRTFGPDWQRGPIGPLKHLQEESGEAQEKPGDVVEFADCFLLILDASRRAGFTLEQLMVAACQKHQGNKSRKYEVKPGDEVCHHIEP